MPRRSTEVDYTHIKRLIMSGLRDLTQKGETVEIDDRPRGGPVMAMVYSYADRDYRVYKMYQDLEHNDLAGLYFQIANESLSFQTSKGLIFDPVSEKKANVYKDKRSWEINAKFKCRIYPSVVVEFKTTVFFSRGTKNRDHPEGGYTTIRVFDYQKIASKLRAPILPTHESLDKLDDMIDKALFQVIPDTIRGSHG